MLGNQPCQGFLGKERHVSGKHKHIAGKSMKRLPNLQNRVPRPELLLLFGKRDAAPELRSHVSHNEVSTMADNNNGLCGF
jgi:hypothetical protein